MSETPCAGPTEEPGSRLERAWLARRLAARLIDGAVLAIPTLLWLFVVSWLVLAAAWNSDASFGGFGGLLLLVVAAYVPAVVYEVALTARSGQTLGKDALGIMVVRRDDGQLPHARESFVRWLVLAVSGIVGVTALAALPRIQGEGDSWWGLAWLLAGWLVPVLLVCASSLWHSDRRGWHDKAAGTVVVKDSSPDQQRTPTGRQSQQPTSSESARPDSKGVHDSGPSWGMVSDYYGPRRVGGADGDTGEHTSGSGS